MLFGIAGVVGTLTGGWANDRFGGQRTLPVQLGVLASTMALVPDRRPLRGGGGGVLRLGRGRLRDDGAAAVPGWPRSAQRRRRSCSR